MPTLVTRFDITGTSSEVPAARRAIVEKTRAWGVPLDDDTACTVGVVASELVTNAVVHTTGAVTVSLYHQPGRLLIEVLDTSSDAPLAHEAGVGEEHGRGMELVGALAASTGWQHVERGKRVWAEIAVPKPPPLLRAAVLRRYFTARSGPCVHRVLQPFLPSHRAETTYRPQPSGLDWAGYDPSPGSGRWRRRAVPQPSVA
ncbi:ATP-binding protein [Streptomyces sp. P9(2023)]|uniref:ATP-binding protein n=1 Tax=Streptomyces sp. P9(2023) TaxID=3064394 RepID=UPI0028F42CC0|nr:ATP-binding protein [Streptomyces sp. P9(2023)]MDT9689483.1 ATP-binding protein [Streptomyces sp. P9(2023)]